MQHDWFRGRAVTVRYDDQREVVLVVANNGRVPTLELPAAAIVSATVDAGVLRVVGGFAEETAIALKLPPADSEGIAAALRTQLQLPRAPRVVTRAEITSLANETYVAIEGRCWSLANHGVLDGIALLGMTTAIELNAPYRITGFYRRTDREELRVTSAQHLNPPLEWYAGATVRVLYAPERELILLQAVGGHTFREPAGTYMLQVPPLTIAWVAADGDRLTFEGDLTRTGYGSTTTLAPIAAQDARAIFALLDERFQIPRTPRSLAIHEVPTITAPTLVHLEGTFRPGHLEGPNFDGGIQLANAHHLVAGVAYSVTGFLYPAFTPTVPFPGYAGPRVYPLAIAARVRPVEP
jgi:hypothetical protein